MSEQVRQRQVTLNEGQTFLNTKGVYGSKFGNETDFLSFAAIVAARNGTEGSKLTFFLIKGFSAYRPKMVRLHGSGSDVFFLLSQLALVLGWRDAMFYEIFCAIVYMTAPS